MRFLLPLAALASLASAETGLAAWLRYAPYPGAAQHISSLPQSVVALNATRESPVFTAGTEIREAFHRIFNLTVKVDHPPSKSYANTSAVVIGTVAEYEKAYGSITPNQALITDGYWLDTTSSLVKIVGENERGALYGAFAYLSMIAQGNFSKVAYASNPVAPIRWINQWDNLDGSITRGYGGLSIFFEQGQVRENLDRVTDYARLMASVGLNAIVINNVNADSNILNSTNIAGMGRVADAMRPYGVQIGASMNFAAPMLLGNLSTFDPLVPAVVNWWEQKAAAIYAAVPDFAGYLIKANSEGQPGPLTYNRTLVQGANMFADTLEPYGGLLIFRAFVYNLVDYSDWTADRAKAAQDLVGIYNGQYRDNVVIQAKYGPIDFQIREPVQPIFANLNETNSCIELEVAQEYLGQQDHVVYLPPLWQTIFQFDMRVNNETSLTRDLFTGRYFNRPQGGSAAVVNVGLNQTWLGSNMAQSNLYAYGRLAWDNTLDSQAILEEWTRLTFSFDQSVINAITDISMSSWPAYENYSGNLGVQTLTDILYTHYGPNPISQEYNGYGQWFRISQTSIGMDRTCFNGTGPGTCYSGQYQPQVYEMYENIETTPDNLLLWFHHVPFTHVLKSGKTIIQDVYDQHYAGADTANTYPGIWSTVQGKIDDGRFNAVAYKFAYQAGHSVVWRDMVNNFFYNWSSIPDELNRVGNHPYRLQAESMTLDGYRTAQPASPPYQLNETAIVTISNSTTGTATATIPYPPGVYDVVVDYYDLYKGISTWDLFINKEKLGSWRGNAENVLGHELTYYLDGNSESRIRFANITVAKGDTVKIVGHPDGLEPAPVNYIAFIPQGTLVEN